MGFPSADDQCRRSLPRPWQALVSPLVEQRKAKSAQAPRDQWLSGFFLSGFFSCQINDNAFL